MVKLLENCFVNKYAVIDFFDDRSNEIKEFSFTIKGTLDFLKNNKKIMMNSLLQ